MDNAKKVSDRFPLRLPEDVGTAVRQVAHGDGSRPPASINETIVWLLREGLRATGKKEPATR